MSSTPLTLCLAKPQDLPTLIQLLADDPLGKNREAINSQSLECYKKALNQIVQDPNAELFVLVNQQNEVIGMAQMNYLTYLTYQGGTRAQIEGVRVAAAHRNQGYGKQFFQMLIARAQEKGCHLVQLTTDKKRPNAARFYQQLGFVDSHLGMKLHF